MLLTDFVALSVVCDTLASAVEILGFFLAIAVADFPNLLIFARQHEALFPVLAAVVRRF